jgi:hypothetical protein
MTRVTWTALATLLQLVSCPATPLSCCRPMRRRRRRRRRKATGGVTMSTSRWMVGTGWMVMKVMTVMTVKGVVY